MKPNNFFGFDHIEFNGLTNVIFQLKFEQILRVILQFQKVEVALDEIFSPNNTRKTAASYNLISFAQKAVAGSTLLF